MQLWRKMCTILTILLLLGVVLLNQFGSPVTHYMMERQVRDYLQERGYVQQDLLKVQTIYSREERNPYTVQVFFADAPNQPHYYVYDDNQKIQEIEKIG